MNILWVVWAVGIVLLLARLFQGKKKTSGLSKTAYTTFKLISKVLGAAVTVVGFLFVARLVDSAPQSADIVQQTDVISPDVGMHTILFRFELPAGTTLGLPTGQHVIVAGVDEAGKPVARPYTPVSDEDTVGYVDLIIKIYPQGSNLSACVRRECPPHMLAEHPRDSFLFLRIQHRQDGQLFEEPAHWLDGQIQGPEWRVQVSGSVIICSFLLRRKISPLPSPSLPPPSLLSLFHASATP